MSAKTILSGLVIFIFCHVPLFAAQVVETDDIDSFMNDEKIEKTQPSTAARPVEDERIPHKIFSLGIGFNFGIFVGKDIDDVNRHIYEKTLAKDDWSLITQSEANIYLNMVPRLTINIMPVRYFMIQLVGEVGWGPKVVTSFDTDTITYHYMRYSPGLILNGYIPIGETGRYSFFLGGGVFYHFFYFDGFEARGFGGRGQLGFRIDWKSVGLEIFGAYDYARAETGDYDQYIQKKMVLDYSSVLIGLNLYFKII
jgi:hypothetical protein